MSLPLCWPCCPQPLRGQLHPACAVGRAGRLRPQMVWCVAIWSLAHWRRLLREDVKVPRKYFLGVQWEKLLYNPSTDGNLAGLGEGLGWVVRTASRTPQSQRQLYPPSQKSLCRQRPQGSSQGTSVWCVHALPPQDKGQLPSCTGHRWPHPGSRVFWVGTVLCHIF